MLFEMNVEEMTKKVGNPYILANLIGKVAKQISQNPPQEVVDEIEFPIQVACEEILKDEVKVEIPKED
jgi:DNA-directed RNA polymerase subunit K/omega